MTGRLPSGLSVTLLSFGYKHRQPPEDADMVEDMRFLDNPYWVEDLRDKTGLDGDVAAYIAAQDAFQDYLRGFKIRFLMLAQEKASITVAFGCTGGQHRSVYTAACVQSWLEEFGVSRLSIRHSEI